MYDIKITNKELNLYVAFKCSTPSEAIHGVEHALNVLQKAEKDKQ